MSTVKAKASNNPTKWALIGGVTVGIGSILYAATKLRLKPHESIPMLPGFHPYKGHASFWIKNSKKIHDALRDLLLKQNEDMVSMNLPSTMTVFLLSPEIIQWVFTTEFDKFWKSKQRADLFTDVFGEYGQGIFVADGKEWRFHRKIASRMFSLRNLKEYMYQCCLSTTDKTLNKLKDLYISKSVIDINDILGRMTFDCFTSLAFGVEFDSMSIYPKQHAFGKAFDSGIDKISRRNYDPLWRIKKSLGIGYERIVADNVKEINKFTKSVIAKKNKQRDSRLVDETGRKTFDLFSLYKANNPNITDEDMKVVSLHFIIAGRDTTRMLLSWFLYSMDEYSDIKKKVIQEIDNCASIDFNTIKNGLKYLEAVLCETLRYHPAVPFAGRVAIRDITVPKRVCGKEYKIKKGDRLLIHCPTIARSTKFYKNPNKFDPSRFIDKGVRTFPPHVYPFFNQNPRLCLGRDFALMEAKIFVYHFFKNYNYELTPNQEVLYGGGAILNMINGLKINITPRN